MGCLCLFFGHRWSLESFDFRLRRIEDEQTFDSSWTLESQRIWVGHGILFLRVWR